MSLGPFQHSDALSMGVELELQLLNLSDFDLTPASSDLLFLLGKKEFPGTVTPEITESMIEIATGVHTNYADLLSQLQDIKDVLTQAADRLNIGICGGGTHPFQRWAERKIFPKPRYLDVSALYGYLAKQFTVFGQHIHIGCKSGNDALFLLHALNCYVPHFIALSASSPYVQGKDTLFQSARLNSIFAFPLSGRAPFHLEWDAFVRDYFNKMALTGIVHSMKDFYWDIRPKPEYGTVELRVCDTPLTVGRAAALAAYLQALCAYLLDRRELCAREDDYLVYNYNRFQACRFGLDGEIVQPRSYEHVKLRDDVLATFEKLQPYAKKLNSLAALDHLATAIEIGSDADALRAEFASRDSVEDVVNYSMRIFN